jgi:hypothetical protein
MTSIEKGLPLMLKVSSRSIMTVRPSVTSDFTSNIAFANPIASALAAERHFRHHLATRNVLHDSLPMLIGRECASPAIIGEDEITHRRDQTGIENPWALTYPEQVKIARLRTRPTFLRAATDPDVYDTQRHALATREVEKIIPDRDDADPWRATNRVWTAITHLTDRRRDARIYGVPIRDTYYNMLRLI